MTLAADSEADLVTRAKAGDSDAFGELHRRHRGGVRGYIRVRARNDTDADEIEQKTWISVWRRLADYDPAIPFVAFVKYLASLQLLQFYARTPYVHILISALAARFPELRNESEIWELLTRAPVASTSSSFDMRLEARERLRLYDRALEVTFETPLPPHQYLAFGFVKLLEWKPSRLASECGDVPLRQLTEAFERAYVAASQLPASRVRTRFARLRETMTERLGDLVQDTKTRETHAALLATVIGDTALRDYAHTPLEQSISHWWEAVRRREAKHLRRAGVGAVPA